MDLFEWLRNACGERPAVHIPDGSRTPPVRRRYRFSGIVQGVGFRYEARILASQLGLTGWARNESDGTVLVEIEGGAAYVDAFVRAMREVPRFDITDVEEEDLPVLGTETAFKVRY